MVIYRKAQGIFSPEGALNRKKNEASPLIKENWIRTESILKKHFNEDTDWENLSKNYDIENATPLALIKGPGGDGGGNVSWGLDLRPMLPQRHQIAHDVDWSCYDYIVIETGETIPVDTWTTSPTAPSAYGVQYKNGEAYAILKDGALFNLKNSNFAIQSLKKQSGDYRVVLNWRSGYDRFKPYLHDYSRVYGKQLGLRLRWHSVSLNQNFEYLFTNENFLLTPL